MHRRSRSTRLVATLLLSCAVTSWAGSGGPSRTPPRVGTIDQQRDTFVRVRRRHQAVVALDTAVATFTPGVGSSAASTLRVDLIAAIHIADAAYYQRLNALFRDYDVVLYELVAPQDTRPDPSEPDEGNPLRALQTGLRTLLDLDFQLDKVDYLATNLVHADLSLEEMQQAWIDSGDSVAALLARLVSASDASLDEAGLEADLVVALMQSKGRSLRLKRMLAEQLSGLETSIQAIAEPEGSALIGARNQRVVAEVGRQVAGGKRRIGIFYGAGHMPDLARRLAALDMAQQSTRWLTAWDLTRE